MKHEKTIEEKETRDLFANASIPEPKRELFQSILNDFQPAVTKTSTVRIPYQKDGRPSFISLFTERMNRVIKMLVPIVTVTAILVLVVYNKTNMKPFTTSSTGDYRVHNITSNVALDEDLSAFINDYEAGFQNEEKTITDFNEQNTNITEESTLTNFDTLYEANEL